MDFSDVASAQQQQATGDEGDDRTNLIVNYLPPSVTEAFFRQLFEPIGPIRTCRLMTDRQTGKSLCYGFVDYQSHEDAQKAVNVMNGFTLESKRLRVSFARPQSRDITGTNLYVQGVPPTADDGWLPRLFSPFGDIVQSRLLRNAEGAPRGIGFVRFDKRPQAEAAIDALNGQTPEGCSSALVVRFADDSRKPRGPPRHQFQQGPQPFMQPPAFGAATQAGQAASGQPGSEAAFVPPSAVSQHGGFILFVYNLPPNADDRTLYQLFGPYGAISSVKVVRNTHTGTCKGYGFVTMMNLQDALQCIQALNNYPMGDRMLQVSFKTDKRQSYSSPMAYAPRPPMPPAPGSYGPGPGGMFPQPPGRQ